MKNLFEQAIKNNQLLEFALGKDEYFIADKEFGDHSVLLSWTTFILPLIDIKGLDFVHDKIEEMIKVLLDCNIDNQVKNETLLYHLHVYYYLHNEGRIKAQKMTSLNPRIHATLNSYIDYLKKNKEPKVCAIRNAIELIQSRGGL